MKKRKTLASFSLILLCAVLLGGGTRLAGHTLGQDDSLAALQNFFIRQEPVVLETVSDEIHENPTTPDLDLTSKAAVLMDADTGKVIFSHEAHKSLPPASVTKIMTMLLAMEAVDAGKIKLTDKVTISANAASMGGSQMYMEAGETHTLEELMQGMAIASANDAAIAVAEYVAGTETIFVENMNRRAKELSMADTHFANANGLPVANHLTSAYDIAVMSKELLQHKTVMPWLSTWQTTIDVGLPGKEKPFGLSNTNKMLKTYPGVNGIKTGFTQDAGYCLSASATKDDTTLIAVVLGAASSKVRNDEVARLFDYGFSHYASVVLAEKGEKVKKVTLDKGMPYQFYGITASRVTAFVEKGNENDVEKKVVLHTPLKVPLKAGDTIGTLEIHTAGQKTGSCALLCDRDVDKADFFTYYARKIKKWFQ